MFFKKRYITTILVLFGLAISTALLIQSHLLHGKIETTPDIQSGPWGEMQVWDIHLEQPAEYVAFDKTGSSGPFWHFGMLQSHNVRDILASAGCGEEEIAALIAAQVPQKDGSFVIRPPDDILLSLKPDVRSKLYLALAANPLNRLQRDPYVVPNGDIAGMLEGRFHDPSIVREMLKTQLSQERIPLLQRPGSDPATTPGISPGAGGIPEIRHLGQCRDGEAVGQA